MRDHAESFSDMDGIIPNMDRPTLSVLIWIIHPHATDQLVDERVAHRLRQDVLDVGPIVECKSHLLKRNIASVPVVVARVAQAVLEGLISSLERELTIQVCVQTHSS